MTAISDSGTYISNLHLFISMNSNFKPTNHFPSIALRV